MSGSVYHATSSTPLFVVGVGHGGLEAVLGYRGGEGRGGWDGPGLSVGSQTYGPGRG